MTGRTPTRTLVATVPEDEEETYVHDHLRARQRARRAHVVRRPARGAGRRPLRRVPHAVQRDDRQAPRADRVLHERGRHRGRDPLRAGARPDARRPRRRAQRRGPRERRRRGRDRPVAAQGGFGRPVSADRARRRRLRLGRGRRRDRAAQPGRADGDHLLDRGRRADARWRPRLPRAPSRPDRRQPALREDGARERVAGDGERGGEPRPLLGDPRRRRQLRRRHGVHVPGAPARDDRRRADLLGNRGCGRASRRVPGVAALGAAQRDGVLQLPHDPAGEGGVPRGAPPTQGVRRRLVHRRLGRGGGEGDGAAALARRAAAPRRAADADRGAQRARSTGCTAPATSGTGAAPSCARSPTRRSR